MDRFNRAYVDVLGSGRMTVGPLTPAARDLLVADLARLEQTGVGHVMLHLAAGRRAALDIVEEIGQQVLAALARTEVASPLTQQKEVA